MTYLQTRKVKHHYKLLSIAVRMFPYIFWCAKQLHVYLLFHGVTLSYIIGLGHIPDFTHLLFSSSMSSPGGHPQPGWHCRVQMRSGLLQVAGHVRHCWNSWPAMGHTGVAVAVADLGFHEGGFVTRPRKFLQTTPTSVQNHALYVVEQYPGVWARCLSEVYSSCMQFGSSIHR